MIIFLEGVPLLPVKYRAHCGALSYFNSVQDCGEAQTGEGKNSDG